MGKKTNSSLRNILVITALLFAVAGMAFVMKNVASPYSGNKALPDGNKQDETQKHETVEFSLLCAGDVMAHSPNIKSAYNASTGGYDFNDNYDFVRDYISSADLAMCNMETTFKGGAPQGYPLFNAPDALAEAVKNAGFDIAITSNNHMMDTGFTGMQRTIEILRAQGLQTAGSKYEGEKNYIVVDVKGVKVGIVAYTYETSGTDGRITINGNLVSEESAKLINSFNYNELESEDYAKIKKDIDGAKADGAEVIVTYYHWGNEYQRTADNRQIAMAQRTADMGADIIFASHPHVVQSIEMLTSADGRKVPVYYSLGNFISNQRTETLSNRYTEQGLMGMVKIDFDKTNGVIVKETVSAIPVWVDKYGAAIKYAIIPLDGNIDSNPVLTKSGHLQRARQALEDIRGIIAQEYLDGYVVDIKPEAKKSGK